MQNFNVAMTLRSLVFISIMLLISLPAFSYITVSSSSHSAKTGETIYLSVPNAQIGYVDHTTWACSSPYINFLNKDNIGAQIQITNTFEGTAIVELIFVEKYLDHNNRTRAITYYKEFKITCSSEKNINLTSISFAKIEVKIGDIVTAEPIVKPSNATVNFTSITLDYQVANVASIFLFNNQVKVRAIAPGTASATVKTSNGKTAKIQVMVPRPVINSGITDSSGKTIHDSNLFKATKNMENLFVTTLQYKK